MENSSLRVRISWEQYALNLAYCASLRSQDPSTKVGACCLRHDNSVASLGYNGLPSGVELEEDDWEDRSVKYSRIIHAEINALRYVHPGECRLIAVTHLPCNDCLKTIASYRIPLIVYQSKWARDCSSLQISSSLAINLLQLSVSL
jgi:dCMP deaminase